MESITQKARGETVTVGFGETSFSLKAEGRGAAAERRYNYAELPFDLFAQQEGGGIHWFTLAGLLLGASWVLIGGLELAGVMTPDPGDDNQAAMIGIGLVLAGAMIGRLWWLRARAGRYRIFGDDGFQIVFLDDPQFPAIERELTQRRNAALRQERFRVVPEMGAEANLQNLAWLVDRDVITRDEYEQARQEAEDLRQEHKVGF